jgi:hypothetical protein
MIYGIIHDTDDDQDIKSNSSRRRRRRRRTVKHHVRSINQSINQSIIGLLVTVTGNSCSETLGGGRKLGIIISSRSSSVVDTIAVVAALHSQSHFTIEYVFHEYLVDR